MSQARIVYNSKEYSVADATLDEAKPKAIVEVIDDSSYVTETRNYKHRTLTITVNVGTESDKLFYQVSESATMGRGDSLVYFFKFINDKTLKQGTEIQTYQVIAVLSRTSQNIINPVGVAEQQKRIYKIEVMLTNVSLG